MIVLYFMARTFRWYSLFLDGEHAVVNKCLLTVKASPRVKAKPALPRDGQKTSRDVHLAPLLEERTLCSETKQ